jgi:PPK2 family polyphosphate:nucleotide phosphotransferase
MKHLSDISTRAPEELDKKGVKEETARLQKRLSELQNLLYAGAAESMLVVLQGMDASGKDGAINNVFGNLNLMGVQVYSFKVPTKEERAHDFLWRVHSKAPAKGMIGVFNRSHYEDVLVTRVHGWCDDQTAKARFSAINRFEDLLRVHNKTTILKFYLHISPEEQAERFQERLDIPSKHWKYNRKDLDEAKLWDKYRHYYEEVFQNCNDIPWIIVPSDQNWYKEYLITKTVVEALEKLDMKYPQPEEAH